MNKTGQKKTHFDSKSVEKQRSCTQNPNSFFLKCISLQFIQIFVLFIYLVEEGVFLIRFMADVWHGGEEGGGPRTMPVGCHWLFGGAGPPKIPGRNPGPPKRSSTEERLGGPGPPQKFLGRGTFGGARPPKP